MSDAATTSNTNSAGGVVAPKLPGGVTRTSSEEGDEVVLRSELLGDARERIDRVR